MSDVKKVDARGFSCPQPVMMTSDAIKKMDKGTVEVLVDSPTALENVTRIAKNSGWQVTEEKQSDGSSRLVLKK